MLSHETLLCLQIAYPYSWHSKLPKICSSFSNWMNAGWNYYLLITNLSNFKNQMPNRTVSVLFLFGKKPHPKTKYVIVSWFTMIIQIIIFLSTHAIENWTETQIMGTLGMIHKSGATFSIWFFEIRAWLAWRIQQLCGLKLPPSSSSRKLAAVHTYN